MKRFLITLTLVIAAGFVVLLMLVAPQPTPSLNPGVTSTSRLLVSNTTSPRTWDVAADLPEALTVLARQIVDLHSDLWHLGSRYHGVRISVEEAENGNRSRLGRLAGQALVQVAGSKVPVALMEVDAQVAAHGVPRSGGLLIVGPNTTLPFSHPLDVRISSRESGIQGPMVSARSADGTWTSQVAYNLPKELHVRSSGNPADLVLIRFRTAFAGAEDEAVLDARYVLARRLTDEITRLARRESLVDLKDEPRFREKLLTMFDLETLTAQGTTKIKVDNEVESVPGVVESWVVWTSHERNLRVIAAGVRSAIQEEDRLPMMKVGLGIGTALLCILLWLRVDWWLKGRYAFLTKFAFVILYAVGLGLIWSWSL